MKTFLAKAFTRRSIGLCWIPLCFLATRPVGNAAPLQEARVSQVIQEVRLLEAHGTARPAVVNDRVTQGRAVRTGVESRAELTFADLTITRLGANTIFSFTGARELDLKSGAILMEVPAKAAPLRASTTSVTVAITGGTALFAKGPPTKFMVLEGIGTFYPIGHPEKAVTVHAGEMVMMTADKKVTEPEEFDVNLLLKTSLLIIDFPPLANLPLILRVVNQQFAEQLLLGTTSHPLARNLVDVIDVTDQSANANPIFVAARIGTPPPTATPSITPPPTPTPSITPPPTPTPSITPSPTPTKFGTPATITSPNPYLIASGTVITTDPSIATNGVTDFGKIYRGPTDDGTFTLWAYGSTSAFDIALNLDSGFFSDPANLPLAVFKFQSLSLNGNPMIETTNGVTRLGLIGVDGISSGPPGGTLTFAGLDGLYLGTVNGSINLTSDISFANLGILAIYARGTGSNLTINSPISNIGELQLVAEGSVQLTDPATMSVGTLGSTAGGNLSVQIGGSLLLNGTLRLDTLVLPGTTLASGANVILNVGNNFTNSSSTDISRLRVRNEGAHIGAGGNIVANIGGDLTTTGTGGDFELIVQNANGRIDNGGNIALTVGGSIGAAGALSATLDNTGGIIGADAINILISSGAITVQGDATFQILNSDNGIGGSPGRIGGNAIIGVSSVGDFSANSLNAIINDRHAGSIGSTAELGFNVGGALSITNDASLGISARNDGTGGGTIGSDATVGLSAGSISVGGAFTTFVSTNGGGSVAGNAINEVGATGDLIAQGPILMSIEDTGFNQINPINFIAGGHIGGDATVTLAAQNIRTFSTATGVPGTDTMALEASIYSNGSGTIGGNAIVNVLASESISATGTVFFTVANGNYQGFGPGTIGGDARVNVAAGSLSTGALFDDIYNYGGATIGRDAAISLNISNGFTATGDTRFAIFNSGGSITRNASINVTAGDISAPSLLAQIDNTGGSIGATTEGGATINMNVSGGANVTNDATVAIYGSDGAASAAINIDGGNYNVGGTFLSYIDGNGTITFNNATAHADVLKAGVFGANGALNIGGGMLSADSTLKLYAPGSNGSLNFLSNVTLGGNSLKILAANSVTIFNNVVVTIGGPNPADVYTNNANYTGFGGNGTTTGTFAGAGANNPQPLANAPPFGPISLGIVRGGASIPGRRTTGGTPITTVKSPTLPTTARTTNGTTSTKTAGTTINVRNTDQLLSLLDHAVPAPGGKIMIANSKPNSDFRNSSRPNADRLLRVNRDAMDRPHMRARSASDSRMVIGKRIL
jgi:acrosin